DQGLRISEEERIQEEEEADELYRDIDINQGRGLQVSQDIKDSHVTLTLIQPDGQQESSSVSSFVTSMLNPTSDAGVESIFMTASSPIAPLPTTTPIMTPSTIATITTSSDAPIPPTTIPSTVKEQVSRILPRIKEFVNAQLEAEVLTRSSNSSRTSYAVAAYLTEMKLKKILIENMEGNKYIQRSDEQQNLYKALVPSEVKRIEAEQLKIILKRSRQETHISQHGGFSTDEGTASKPGVPDVPSDDLDEEISWNSSDEEDDDNDNDEDDEEEIAKLDEQEDTESDEGDAEETESDGESEEEETREEEEDSFDLIPRTSEDDEDDGNGDEDQGLRISEEERIQEEEEADELYHDQESSSVSSFVTSMLNPTVDAVFRFKDRVKALEVNFSEFMQTNQFAEAVSKIPSIVHQYMTQQMTEAVREAVQIQTDRLQDSFQRENDEFLHTIDENMKKIIKGQVKSQVKEQVLRILPLIEESVNAQLDVEVLTRSSNSSRTSYAVAADLTEMELKKIFIEKMEGNKSIQRSDEQRNLYKALVDAYEADKTILESYGDTAILKRRRRDDDDQEGPSAGSDRGHRDEDKVGSMNQLALYPNQQPEVQAGLQQGLNLDRCQPQADSRSSFNELLDTPIDFSNFIMNRLGVDTLTPELLAGPTYELMRRLCTSLTEFEYHLEEVYKATTDQLDWVNPEGQQYPHNLLQPLPLIPDNRGRRVIPFAHFINNDLKYLRGGDFKRLRPQDIEDMLLLLVQGKLSNLTVEERFAFNVSLWMFTRSVIIQRRVEDLQLGVESYRKRLNLTKPDTYRSDLKRCEADGTLKAVHNALDDRLKGIRMQYLPQAIWRKGDKDRAVAMIQSIDKMLKTRRIMRSLEPFVGGRLYEGDFWMLQRTI
nr:hypothetical protein [Tanacetum cinerariifolium]